MDIGFIFENESKILIVGFDEPIPEAQLNALEDSVTSYIESVEEWTPEGLVIDVLRASGIGGFIVMVHDLGKVFRV